MPNRVYKIAYRYGYRLQNQKELYVLAKDAAQAVDHVRRYAKKSYWQDGEIVLLEKTLVIDVQYRK